MRVALGFKSHSGWAALVVIGLSDNEFQVVDRRRIELIPDGEIWAKQPYHAADALEPDEARAVVARGIKLAHRMALVRMREALKRLQKLEYAIAGCAVLVPSSMPDWSTREILDVHFRMHKAEGVLFPDALCRAAETCKLQLAAVPEKGLEKFAERVLAVPFSRSMETIAKLGKFVGPPWGKDQKNAAIAAMIALRGNFK